MGSQHLDKALRSFSRRENVVAGFRLLQTLCFVWVGGLALLLLVDKAVFLPLPFELIAAGGGALVLLTLLVFLLVRRMHPQATAYRIDKACRFKNLVATGWSVSRADDEISRVIAARAGKALSGARPARVFPLNLGWSGRYLYAPCLACVVAFFLPRMDLLKRAAKREQALAEKADVQQGALKLVAKITAIEEDPSILDGIENKDIVNDLNSLAQSLKSVGKKQALHQLGEFEDKYRDALEAGRTLEEAAKSLQQKPDPTGLDPKSREELEKLTESLVKGDFNTAATAARELVKQLQNANLTPEQKKALARELAKLARQMKNCGSCDRLSELLRRIESSDLDPSEISRLCNQAASDLEELSRMCTGCAGLKAMKDGLADAKAAMLGDDFKDFDAVAVEQYMACEASLGGKGIGSGTGGEGKGRGGEPPEFPTATQFKPELSPSKINKGKILHELFVSGVPQKGEALREYSVAVGAARQHAANALAREKIPREYERMVKRYFESLDAGGEDDKATP